MANSAISATLRPVKEDETTPSGEDASGKPYISSGSVDFDTTQNLYIEGDNLKVLKLLRETYLGKVKMIYIDIKAPRLIQFNYSSADFAA